jgi:hypothetical protein
MIRSTPPLGLGIQPASENDFRAGLEKSALILMVFLAIKETAPSRNGARSTGGRRAGQSGTSTIRLPTAILLDRQTADTPVLEFHLVDDDHRRRRPSKPSSTSATS